MDKEEVRDIYRTTAQSVEAGLYKFMDDLKAKAEEALQGTRVPDKQHEIVARYQASVYVITRVQQEIKNLRKLWRCL